jgi:hypothetical protein
MVLERLDKKELTVNEKKMRILKARNWFLRPTVLSHWHLNSNIQTWCAKKCHQTKNGNRS